jgi:hypothetical protein
MVDMLMFVFEAPIIQYAKRIHHILLLTVAYPNIP